MNLIPSWFGGRGSSNDELPDIFPMPIKNGLFVETDVVQIYSKILTDVVERTDGIPEKILPTLWDNCLQNEHSEGLVTMLSKAMADQKELFLVYDSSINLLRKADSREQELIRADYKQKGESSLGTFVSFRNYKKTEMVRLYSMLEYCAISSLYKNMNISKAVQLKFNDMRGSVAINDRSEFIAQAVELARALQAGRDIAIDAKDLIDTAKPDVTATTAAMDFINQRRSFYLGMPASYITGEAPKGLGDSGEGDAKQVERGLKNYYFSIIKPVMESVFGIKTSFKTEDFNQISSSLEALRTFELVSDELISKENKLGIVNKMFGFPEGTTGDEPEEIEEPENPEDEPQENER